MPRPSRPSPLPACLLALALGLAALPTAPPLRGAEPAGAAGRGAALASRFTKREVLIPMRDGVRLHTVIYQPKRPGRRPILLNRTPYGCWPYGPGRFPAQLGPAPEFDAGEYILVFQDVRGRFLSGDTFTDMRPMAHRTPAGGADESTDAHDTIQWLLDHLRDHNGRVGMWGVSYPGFYAAAALVDPHPALKAVSPQAPIVDLWEGDDGFHHGAFQLAGNFGFYLNFRSRPGGPSLDPGPEVTVRERDGYAFLLAMGPLANLESRIFRGREPLWTITLAHPDYDAFWQARDLRPHLRAMAGRPGPAVLTVGGWYDAEDLFGSLACHRELAPSGRARLVMGPWSHGQWEFPEARGVGEARYAQDSARPFQRQVLKPFFDHHLREAPDPRLPGARIFDTGTGAWADFPAWPPPDRTPASLTLRPDGGLGLPGQSPPPAGERSFVSDPASPVPYTQERSLGMTTDYMAEDQRFAAARPDVLVFRSTPLEAPLRLAGPLKAVLRVATTGTDADWVVKLIDEGPGGTQVLVRGDVLRGKYRRDPARPVPFVPGQPEEVAFTLPDILHTFRPGHRVMIQVQCSWFPLVDRNPQTFCDIPRARPGDFKAARMTVFMGPERGSRMEVGVLAGKDPATP